MAGRVNVYVIWYGSFPSWSSTHSLVDYFISNWGASHSYAVVRNYTDNTGARVAPELSFAEEFIDSTASAGTNLGSAEITTYISNLINRPSPAFPFDPNGIYLFIFGQHISVSGFCGDCAYHGTATVYGRSPNIKYGVIGAGNCGGCGVPSSPNGNSYADATVNAIAHEVAETVTDPYDNAWGTGQNEIGDKCNFVFDEQHKTPNGGSATAQVGANYYMIQKLWTNTSGGGCYSGYSPPAAIIWQLGAGGVLAAWKMQDENTVSSYIGYNISGQNVVAVGDFQNGIDPQVLTITANTPTNTALTMTTLHSDGTSASSPLFAANFDSTAWTLATGDFNGDGFSDILFSNPSSGDVWVYFMQGTTILNTQYVGNYLPWIPQGVADFNGDGLADIFWVDSPANVYSVWTSYAPASGPSVSFTIWGAVSLARTPILAAADLNGDSRADVIYYPNDPFTLFTDEVNFLSNYGLSSTTILPGYAGATAPPWAGLVDANRDGTADVYVQTSSGLVISPFATWKTLYDLPIFGIALNDNGRANSDAGGWKVVATGGFKEN